MIFLCFYVFSSCSFEVLQSGHAFVLMITSVLARGWNCVSVDKGPIDFAWSSYFCGLPGTYPRQTALSVALCSLLMVCLQTRSSWASQSFSFSQARVNLTSWGGVWHEQNTRRRYHFSLLYVCFSRNSVWSLFFKCVGLLSATLNPWLLVAGGWGWLFGFMTRSPSNTLFIQGHWILGQSKLRTQTTMIESDCLVPQHDLYLYNTIYIYTCM